MLDEIDRPAQDSPILYPLLVILVWAALIAWAYDYVPDKPAHHLKDSEWH